jgi:hypothetical protein
LAVFAIIDWISLIVIVVGAGPAVGLGVDVDELEFGVAITMGFSSSSSRSSCDGDPRMSARFVFVGCFDIVELLVCLAFVIEDFVIFLNNAYIFPVVVPVNFVLVVIVVVRDVCRREPTGTYKTGVLDRSVHLCIFVVAAGKLSLA